MNPYDTDLQKGLMRALVQVGNVLSRVVPRGRHTRFYFFFPYFHVGGAERVHADIVGCVPKGSAVVFFTHQSRDKKFIAEFTKHARCLSLWPIFKYLLPLCVGYVAGVINRTPGATTFGSNSRFFYKLVPFLSEQVKKIDLIHAFGGGAEFFSLEAVRYLDRRVVITPRTLEDFRRQYYAGGIDPQYLERVVLIENAVAMPDEYRRKERADKLTILYVGRGTEEKRVHLVGRAAALCGQQQIPVQFLLAGDVDKAVIPEDRQWCRFVGEISDPAAMAALYEAADVLVLTSRREGFPMVVMEAMARGVVPVATAVGGIPRHVHDGVTGILLEGCEAELPAEIAEKLSTLCLSRDLLDELSARAYEYAASHFSKDRFYREYRRVLEC